MLGQQIYWKSVWEETVRDCQYSKKLDVHSKAEERRYKKMLRRAQVSLNHK